MATPVEGASENRTAENVAHENSPLAESFQAAWHIFISNDAVQNISLMFQKIPQLEKYAHEKNNDVLNLQQELKSLKASHEADKFNNLSLYEKKYDKFKEDKAQLQDEMDKLKEVLREKDRRIVDLEKNADEFKTQGKRLKATYDEVLAKSKEKDQAVFALEKQISDWSKKYDNLNQRLLHIQDGNKKLQSLLGKNNEAFDNLTQDFRIVSTRLNALEGYSVTLQEIDMAKMTKEIDRLWESTTALVRNFFMRDMSLDIIEEVILGFEKHRITEYGFPIPRSNSPTAKEIRMIIALASLARIIDQYIFQPNYILDLGDQFRNTSQDLAVKDSEKERFLRGMVLSMPSYDVKDSPGERIDWARKAFMKASGIQEMVGDERVGDFKQQLYTLLSHAQSIWSTAQSGKQRLEPDFDYPEENQSWATFESQVLRSDGEGSRTVASPTRNNGASLDLVIFPRVYIMQEEPKPITTGTVLRQKQLSAAKREVQEIIKNGDASPTAYHQRNKSNRRDSFLPRGPGRG